MASDFVPLEFDLLAAEEQLRRARKFYELMSTRRSVRHFSPDPVPMELIETAIRTAGSAPSGANMQPWRFVLVSDPRIRKQIRLAAEEEERRNYDQRFTEEWLEALAPLGTSWRKEFLEIAPHLIAVFRVDYDISTDPQTGQEMHTKHYYVMESVGIAVGFLLAALHQCGLATLTHTPSPMGFLSRILSRPRNEKPYLLIPVGYPAQDAVVPNISRKPLSEILTRIG